MRTVLTLGTFDTTHAGHINFLTKCMNYGDLIIGLNSDEFITSYKGAPLFTYEERAELLENLNLRVTPNADAGHTLIKAIQPDVLAIGSDWARKDYLSQIGMTHDELDELGIDLVYIPYTKLISTTEIRKRVQSHLNRHGA